MAPFFWIALLCEVAYCAVLPSSATSDDASRTTMRPNTSQKEIKKAEGNGEDDKYASLFNSKNPAIKLPEATGAWLTVSCDKPSIKANEYEELQKLYLEAGVAEAWDDLMSGWISYSDRPQNVNSISLRFPFWMANVYRGPEGNPCDFAASFCQSAVCGADRLAPAKEYIQNNFGFLWDIFHDVEAAYTGARDQIKVKMGKFTAAFAPIIDNKEMMQHLLELFLFAGLVFIPTGFASLATKEIAALTKAAIKTGEEAGRKAGIKAGKQAVKDLNPNLSDAAIEHASEKAIKKAADKATKEVTDAELAKKSETPFGIAANVLVGSAVYVHNTVGNYLKSAETLADERMAFEDYISGYLLDIIEQANQSHSALVELRDEESRKHMRGLIADASLHIMNVETKQSGWDRSKTMREEAEKVLWGMLLRPAWTSVQVPKRPFILRVDKKDYKCNDPITESKLDLDIYMSDETRKNTIWCDPDGNSFFLLQTNIYPTCAMAHGQKCKLQQDYKHFSPLPGGTASTLKEITGLGIGDIVYAQYGAYLHNDKRNGYVMAQGDDEVVGDDFKVRPGEFNLPMSGGLRIPGFFNISVCTDAETAARNTQAARWGVLNAPC